MRLLLDTHALIWSQDDPGKLSGRALTALQDPSNSLLLSAATVWELAIKLHAGKLKLSSPFRTWIEKAVRDLGLSIVPITIEFADRQSGLPNHHKDPFDRLLIAQAIVEGVPIVSVDSVFDAYPVTRLW